MDFCLKILFGVVVLSANVCCFFAPIDYYPLTRSCYINHLHEHGKLAEPLPSIVQPPPSRCRLVIAVFKNLYFDKFTDALTPEKADCIIKGTVIDDWFDYMVKRSVVQHSSLFKDTEVQLEETEQHLQNLTREIIAECKTNETDAIKNLTIEERQTKYCLVKYVNDNQLLPLSKTIVERALNPEGFDKERVNCTNVIASERSKFAKQLEDKVDASDCAMDEFRRGDMFYWKVLFILSDNGNVYIPGVNFVVDMKVEELLSMSATECNVK